MGGGGNVTDRWIAIPQVLKPRAGSRSCLCLLIGAAKVVVSAACGLVWACSPACGLTSLWATLTAVGRMLIRASRPTVF